MKTSHRSPIAPVAVALIAAIASLGMLLAGAADAAGFRSCTLVSSSRLQSTVALSHSLVLSRTTGTPASASPVIHDYCDYGVWTGSPPVGQAAALLAAKSGHAAQVGFETWAPNSGSPSVGTWRKHDYDELTSEFDKTAALFPGIATSKGWPSKRFEPAHIHRYTTKGFVITPTGVSKGLAIAVACWWDDTTSSAICLMDEEAAAKPVVKHLDQLAAVVVPKFLG
jgi:hypothetical protein